MERLPNSAIFNIHNTHKAPTLIYTLPVAITCDKFAIRTWHVLLQLFLSAAGGSVSLLVCKKYYECNY